MHRQLKLKKKTILIPASKECEICTRKISCRKSLILVSPHSPFAPYVCLSLPRGHEHWPQRAHGRLAEPLGMSINLLITTFARFRTRHAERAQIKRQKPSIPGIWEGKTSLYMLRHRISFFFRSLLQYLRLTNWPRHRFLSCAYSLASFFPAPSRPAFLSAYLPRAEKRWEREKRFWSWLREEKWLIEADSLAIIQQRAFLAE